MKLKWKQMDKLTKDDNIVFDLKLNSFSFLFF